MPTDTFHNLPDEKRTRILDAAIEEFAAHPYDSASTSAIARQADIAKGSLYQYFEDKKGLYRYLIELGTEERGTLMKTLPAPDPDSDLFGYLRWLFLSAVVFEYKRPHLARLAYRAFVEEVPLPEMTEELRRRGTTQFFKQLLSQGILHGTVAPHVDPDTAAFLLESAYYQVGKYIRGRLKAEGSALDNKKILENETLQQILDNLMSILTGGMQN
jgi:AcrR family transcriptional regulator